MCQKHEKTIKWQLYIFRLGPQKKQRNQELTTVQLKLYVSDGKAHYLHICKKWSWHASQHITVNFYSKECLIRVWFVDISTYWSSRVPFSKNNVLHLQVILIFLKKDFFFLTGIPVFITKSTLKSCFCKHSCIQKVFSCKKDLLQQSNNQVLILCITA